MYVPPKLITFTLTLSSTQRRGKAKGKLMTILTFILSPIPIKVYSTL